MARVDEEELDIDETITYTVKMVFDVKTRMEKENAVKVLLFWMLEDLWMNMFLR